MHPRSFLGFLFLLLAPGPAFAVPLVDRPNLNRDSPECKQNNYFEVYSCSTIAQMGKPADSQWPKTSRMKCEVSICKGSTFPPEASQKEKDDCFRQCMSNNDTFRRRVCNNCEPSVSSKNPPGGGVVQEPIRDPTHQAGNPDTDTHRRPTSGQNTSTENCSNNEECFRKGAEAQRKAEQEARERRIEAWKASREAQQNKESTISSASDLLGAWRRKLDSEGRPNSVERAQFQSDQRLVQQAMAAKDGRGTFTAEDALRANDPGVMRELSMHVEARELERDNADDHKRLKAEEEKFHALAVESTKRALQLGANPGKTEAQKLVVTTVATSAPVGGSAGAEASSNNHFAASRYLASDKADVAAAARAAGSLSGSSSGNFGAASGSSSSSANLSPAATSSLRDLLKRRLSGKEKDAALGGEAGKGASHGSDQAVAEAIAASSEHQDTSGATQFQKGSRDAGKEPGFQLGLIDSEKDVRQFIAETNRNAPIQGGLLGMNSSTLFDRVRQAHRSCQLRDCVRDNPH